MLAIMAVLMASACLGACSKGNSCDGQPASKHATAPRIEALSLLRQVTSDPWTLVFEVKFTDADGDLGGGTAEFFMERKTPAAVTMSLAEMFQRSEVDLAASSGELGLPLRFKDTVPNGQDVDLELQMIDVKGQRSNCYQVSLHFDVTESE